MAEEMMNNYKKQRIFGLILNPMCIRIVLICLMLSFGTVSFGQLITPLDKGIDAKIVATSSQGNNIYVVKQIGNTPLQEEFEVCVFNGIFWTCLPYFKYNENVVSSDGAYYSITSIVEYKNEVYLAGRLEKGTTSSPTAHLYKFDGTQWVKPTQNINTVSKGINKMVVWNDTLIAAGFFSKAGTRNVSNIATFEGTSWDFLGTQPSSEGANNEITDLEVLNNDLFISGKFTHVGGFHTGSIAKWVSNSSYRGWGGIGAPFIETYDITAKGNDIAASGKTVTGDSSIRLFTSNIWILPSAQTPVCANTNCKPQVVVIGNNLYAYGPFLINSDTVDLIKNVASTWESTSIKIPTNAHFVNLTLNSVCYGDFNFDKNGISFKNIFMLKENKAYVSGHIFGDKNQDCILNGSETGVFGYVFLSRTNNNKSSILVQTDSNGYWETEVEPNVAYKIKAQYLKGTFNGACTEILLPARANGTVTQDINIGLDFSIPKEDLVVTAANLFGKITPNNSNSSIYFYASNAGSVTTVGNSIHASFDSSLIVSGISPTPADQKPGLFTWTVPSLKPGETIPFKITFDAVTKSINTPLQFKIRTGTGTLVSDIDANDNFDTLNTIVNSQTTLNFKTVSKEGGFTKLNELDYGIYFTNNSPNVAKNVSIIDTLDADLPEEVSYINQSHNMLVEKRITDDGVATWTFKNINLPNAENGVAEASGFFTYRFYLNDKTQKAVDQNFTNTAKIVFDYANTRKTNTVETTLLKYTSVETLSSDKSNLLYPVPASSVLHIKNNAQASNQYAVYDINGKIITSFEIADLKIYNLDVSNMSNGLYILTNGLTSSTFVVQH